MTPRSVCIIVLVRVGYAVIVSSGIIVPSEGYMLARLGVYGYLYKGPYSPFRDVCASTPVVRGYALRTHCRPLQGVYADTPIVRGYPYEAH